MSGIASLRDGGSINMVAVKVVPLVVRIFVLFRLASHSEIYVSLLCEIVCYGI